MADLKSSYDAVIVGNDLPALIFGALAAKHGYRILLLGHGGKNNVYEEDGFRFVRRPNLMYGFSESHPIREVFRELALAPEMRNLPRPLEPTCHVIMPGRRIEITHMKGILEEEISREFPQMLDAFRAFTSDQADAEKVFEPILREFPVIPPSGIKEYFAWRKIRGKLAPAFPGNDALAAFGENAAMRAFLNAPVMALSNHPEPWRYPLSFGRVASHLLRGLYNVEWGLDSLKSLFLNRIEGNSGTVRTADFADMFQVKRGRITEVDIRARNEAIGASVLVAGTELAGILDMLPEKAVKKRYRQKVEDSGPSHYLITMNVGLARRGLPSGMARTAFLVSNPDAPLEDDNMLMLQVDPAMEPADSLDPERAVMSISGMLPVGRMDEGASSVEAFSNRMMSKVVEFMPFFDRHLVTRSIASIRISEKTGKAILDPAGMVPVHKNTVPKTMGLVTQPVRTPYANLLYLGEGACGTMGFEGAFTSAYMAFGILKKLLPRKDVI
jgi:phytoene dehydrogenase-like protein